MDELLRLILDFFFFITVNVSCPAKFGNLSIHRVLEELVIFPGVEDKTEVFCMMTGSCTVGRQMVSPKCIVFSKSAFLSYMEFGLLYPNDKPYRT